MLGLSNHCGPTITNVSKRDNDLTWKNRTGDRGLKQNAVVWHVTGHLFLLLSFISDHQFPVRGSVLCCVSRDPGPALQVPWDHCQGRVFFNSSITLMQPFNQLKILLHWGQDSLSWAHYISTIKPNLKQGKQRRQNDAKFFKAPKQHSV